MEWPLAAFSSIEDYSHGFFLRDYNSGLQTSSPSILKVAASPRRATVKTVSPSDRFCPSTPGQSPNRKSGHQYSISPDTSKSASIRLPLHFPGDLRHFFKTNASLKQVPHPLPKFLDERNAMLLDGVDSVAHLRSATKARVTAPGIV